MNHLEQLVSEWYEYNGYFVRRNVMVGKLNKGGYACELDVVAFNPKKNHLVHIEPSLDANSWSKREERFKKKFDHGKKHIRDLFQGLEMPPKIEQIALFVFASNSYHKKVGGGLVATISELLEEITKSLCKKKFESAAVPEQFPLLRTIHFCCDNKDKIFNGITLTENSENTSIFVRNESIIS